MEVDSMFKVIRRPVRWECIFNFSIALPQIWFRELATKMPFLHSTPQTFPTTDTVQPPMNQNGQLSRRMLSVAIMCENRKKGFKQRKECFNKVNHTTESNWGFHFSVSVGNTWLCPTPQCGTVVKIIHDVNFYENTDSFDDENT